uniref:Osteoclast-stimulating factor 1 n=1 Tax=Parastrongyloides trichosuri TaxID=131310 RepID=A0A0N4ZX42_PARTI
MNKPIIPPKPLPKPGKIQVFKANEDYLPNNENELSVEKGQLLYVSDICNTEGYINVSINGKKGLLPKRILSSETSEILQYPLHEASRRGNLKFVKECLDNGVSPNSLDKSGATPLFWACHSGFVDIVKLLLSLKNIDINNKNKMGDTALHAAAWKGRGEIVELLVEAGADVNLKNDDKNKPVDLAKDIEIAAFLKVTMSKIVEKEDTLYSSEEEDC